MPPNAGLHWPSDFGERNSSSHAAHDAGGFGVDETVPAVTCGAADTLAESML